MTGFDMSAEFERGFRVQAGLRLLRRFKRRELDNEEPTFANGVDTRLR
jgi:hypothetical protein